MKQFILTILTVTFSVINLVGYGQTPTPTPTPSPTPVGSYVRLTAPVGGETLVIGQTFRITWDSSPNTEMVSIMLGSGTWIVSTIPNTGYYDWVVDTLGFSEGRFTMAIYGGEVNVGVWIHRSGVFRIVSPTPTPTPTPNAVGDEWALYE